MNTKVEKKCPKCATWNGNVDYCSNCNELLNHQIKLKQQEVSRKVAHENRTLDKVDLAIKSMKTSKYMIVRVLFYLVYSVWMVIFWISSFFITMIALGPG